MDYKSILIEPKNISKLIKTYFILFFQNYKTLIPFNIIVLIGFYFIIGKVESEIYSENYIFDYITKSIYYVLFFTLPVSFISTFYLTLLENRKPTISNITDVFLNHYSKLLTANAGLTLVVFLLNFSVKNTLLMYQYYDPFIFFFIEFVNAIIYFIAILIIYQLNPYKSKLLSYLNNKLIKYTLTLFILMLISILLYRITFNVFVITVNVFEDLLGTSTAEYLYHYGSIIVEYINTIAVFTIFIFIYYCFTAEVKNTHILNEINEINLGLNDEEDDEI
ncbi:hypothetical protein [Faecalibacter bovis]|uniref:ABC transporter permease n=1 Tax=Faecalibacter bovis TaxID=2898187 RepID=A0ABX7XB73_9FLAO|nr:hypothetical protein [Faecalibacter bovis]QTV05140.1 hypothetical protein J9309_10130 [Faecalibacter bovis]